MNKTEIITNCNIQESNIFSDKYCNICTENIESNNLVTLSCNPNHYFCYTCIFDWYNIIKNNTGTFAFNNTNNNNQCTCPICKKDGGVLPLLPPHTDLIIGIHVKGAPSFGGFTLYGFNGTGVAGSKCDHKDCNNQYSFMNVHSKNKLYKNLCYTHFYDFKKGKNLILENDEIFESSYIQCNCKMQTPKYGIVCTNASQNMFSIQLNNKNYYLCNDHKKLYNHGIQITFDDNVNTVSKQNIHFVKTLCCTPNKSKYGYCLNKLDFIGMCKIDSHNNNYVKDSSLILTDSDIDEIFEPTTNTSNSTSKKVMNIHIGLCGVALKNGNGNCQNKGKALHNGKCGKHKNY